MLKIKAGKFTPEVKFIDGNLALSGNCFPENSDSFFIPIMDVLTDYVKKPSESTTFTLKLAYANSSSKRYIFEICSLLESIPQLVKVVFIYEDEEDFMCELHEDVSELFAGLNIELVKSSTS